MSAGHFSLILDRHALILRQGKVCEVNNPILKYEESREIHFTDIMNEIGEVHFTDIMKEIGDMHFIEIQ